MKITTTGTLETVVIGGLSLSHPQTLDLTSDDSPWDEEDLKENIPLIEEAIKLGTITDVTPQSYKLYRYMPGNSYDKEVGPVDVDYKKLRNHKLQKVNTFYKGRVMEKGFYAKAEKNPLGQLVGEDLIVLERNEWFDVAGFLDLRLKTYIWIREDGSEGATKGPFPTRYSQDDAIKEGITRRTNVINNMSPQVIGMLAMTETGGDIELAKSLGQSFITSHLGLIQEYMQAASTSLYGAVSANLVDGWLNNVVDPETGATIRHYIMGELS